MAKTIGKVLGFVTCHLIRDSDGDGWLSEEDARKLEAENDRLKSLASNEDSRCRNREDGRLVCEYWMHKAQTERLAALREVYAALVVENTERQHDKALELVERRIRVEESKP